MLDVVGPEELVVIANTGDDIEIYGAHVSPDPDLVSFWLADEIDERGWGIDGDTFAVMDALRRLGDGRVVQPRRPRPRMVSGAPAHGGRRAAPQRGAGTTERSGRRAHPRVADVRRAAAHVGAHRRGWCGFQDS